MTKKKMINIRYNQANYAKVLEYTKEHDISLTKLISNYLDSLIGIAPEIDNSKAEQINALQDQLDDIEANVQEAWQKSQNNEFAIKQLTNQLQKAKAQLDQKIDAIQNNLQKDIHSIKDSITDSKAQSNQPRDNRGGYTVVQLRQILKNNGVTIGMNNRAKEALLRLIKENGIDLDSQEAIKSNQEPISI